jgi:hypothetical protein
VSTTAPTISTYRPEHRERLLALWSKYFSPWSAERLEKRWSWQFEENPFCAEREPVILIAEQEGKVVGHVAGIPVPLRLDGERHIALATSGLVVDELHRWVAVRLMRSMLGTPPVLGRTEHPSTRKLFDSHRAPTLDCSRERFVFPLRYSGWLCRSIRRRMPESLDAIVTPRSVGVVGAVWHPGHKPAAKRLPRLNGTVANVRPVDSFGAEYDALWARARQRWRYSLAKDSVYMTWRYLKCPTLKPVVLGLHDGAALRAVIVAVECSHWDRSRKPCGSTGEIVELITDDPANPAIEPLIIRAMMALNDRRVDTVDTASLHPSLHPLLKQIGFVPQTAEVFQLGLAVRSGNLSNTASDWYYTAGDSDALYSPGL